MKKFAFAIVFTFAVVGYALAEEITCSITKVDTDKQTITYVKGGKGGFGGKKGGGKKGGADQPAPEPVTVSYAKTVKINKGEMKKDDDGTFKAIVGDEVKDGFKDDAFTKADEKGVTARITIADDGPEKGKVTQILLVKGFGGGGKKKGGN
jgi:hypothetical protein